MWGNEKRFATERMKVVFVLSYMKDGTARTLEEYASPEMMENKRGCTDSWDALAASSIRTSMIPILPIIDSPK